MYDGNYEGNTAGQKKMGRVFDSTAISATQRFANRIQAGLFPPQKQWCRLEADTGIPREEKPQAQAVHDAYTERKVEVRR